MSLQRVTRVTHFGPGAVTPGTRGVTLSVAA
jgi:hypothetical protein